MSNDTISNWVEKAKANPAAVKNEGGVNVVRREPAPSKGQIIMDIADKLLPGMLELFKGVRDGTGMLLQPAHIRGMALNVAQNLVKNRENAANQ